MNSGGNQLDYYLDHSLTCRRTGCGPARDVTVTVAFTNNAPKSGLSRDYVANRTDAHSFPGKPGDLARPMTVRPDDAARA